MNATQAALLEAPVRAELLDANDATIEDAVRYADPMVLRGLLYQLTGDPALLDIGIKRIMMGYSEVSVPATDVDVALIRAKTVAFIKTYRDGGAGPISIGSRTRLPVSLGLVGGCAVPKADLGMYLEELALDPWARSLEWRDKPDPQRLSSFFVTVIGAGMGGLNAALQLRRAGIPYVLIEKNSGVGGTWHENRYPGARVDTASRSYTHLFGAAFPYPGSYCEQSENEKYFNWVADEFDLRNDIEFETEVRSLTWDEDTATWEVSVCGPAGERAFRSNAVITAVGFLNRPNIPPIAGRNAFSGRSWHTARWPKDADWRGKRIAVVGTGCTGYQMIPELALEAEHVTVFQRTPQWLFERSGYRSPSAPQVNWLDRNLPFFTNFMRFRYCYGEGFSKINTIDPDFDDPDACSPTNKLARDVSLAFLRSKLRHAPELIDTMTPKHPVWSARPVMVDPEYSILDAIQRDNVTLVTDAIRCINSDGIEADDGRQYDADIIVYATGFHATEYLFPMTITGRDGKTIDQLWAEGGARAFAGCMMPGFPNLWSIYGPNTNGALPVAAFHEMIALYALQCIEHLILDDKRSIDVRNEVYEAYNTRVDEANNRKVWSDPRARNYYWSRHGRSAVQNPFTGPEMWRLLRRPDLSDLEVR